MGFDPISFARLFVGVTFGILGVGVSAYGFIDAADAYGNVERINSELRVIKGSGACGGLSSHLSCRVLDDYQDEAGRSLAIGVGGIALTAAAGALLMYDFGRKPLPARDAGWRAAAVAVPGGGAVTIFGRF